MVNMRDNVALFPQPFPVKESRIWYPTECSYQILR
uniref:Uncharacterized protein n=1 Tax=Arundo donax TaxID=35708 RepID=A0A0A9B9I0_ARUDO